MTKRTIGGGLGISLEGTVDVEDGVEVMFTNEKICKFCLNVLGSTSSLHSVNSTTGTCWKYKQFLEW